MSKTTIQQLRAQSIAENRAKHEAERVERRNAALAAGLPDPDGPPEFSDVPGAIAALSDIGYRVDHIENGLGIVIAQLDRIEKGLVLLVEKAGEPTAKPTPPTPVETVRVLNPTP